MNKICSRLALAAGLVCAGLQASALADEKPTVSKAVVAPIQDAQKALGNKDFQGAIAKIKEAQAVADRSAYDDYIINRLLGAAEIGLNDMTDAATAIEAAADSPAVPQDDKKMVAHDALQLSAFMKQWPKTIQYGQVLAQQNGMDAPSAAALAIAYYNANDFPHAQQYAQQSIDLAKAAGQPPDENAMKIVMSSQVEQHNQAGAEQMLEQIALQNNSPDSWAKLVGVSFGTRGMSDLGALYLYRLLMLTGGMTPDDYKIMGSLANQLGYPTEAAKVLEQGGQSGAALNKARHDAAADERALPQIAAAAEKSRTGEEDVKLGEDYWGYGRYADAEAAARRAVGKGRLKVPSEGLLLTGAAQAAQGKYADAIQTLSQVTGNEASTRTAHLWSLYAQAKQRPGAPAPAAQSPTH
ncbi:MAG TPA: hypothetical protein VGI20_07460 [Rhizomicrobium sp.]